MPVSSLQFGQIPWHYTNGLRLRNSVVTPLTLIRVSSGSALDSTGLYQISTLVDIGASTLFTGAGGLDSGTVQPNVVYGLYLIGDTVTNNPTNVMFSLSYGAAVSPPLMPYGYDVYSLIGMVTMDGSGNILPGIWMGTNGSNRTFNYLTPVLVLNTGTQTSYTSVSLINSVPLEQYSTVNFYSKFNANAAGDIQNLTTNNSSSDIVTVIAPVSGITAQTTSANVVTAILSQIGPSINYKVSAGSLSLYVTGYTFYV